MFLLNKNLIEVKKKKINDSVSCKLFNIYIYIYMYIYI